MISKALADAYQTYFGIQASLSEDNLAGAKASAESLLVALPTEALKCMPEKIAKDFENELFRLDSAAKEISRADALETARTQFEPLSNFLNRHRMRPEIIQPTPHKLAAFEGDVKPRKASVIDLRAVDHSLGSRHRDDLTELFFADSEMLCNVRATDHSVSVRGLANEVEVFDESSLVFCELKV